MRSSDCPREAEVLEALQTSAWPGCCRATLRAHVDTCETCSDLLAVALPLIADHRAASLEAPVPASGVVWWRAQTRARQEAAAAAMRPITIVQGLALACATGLLAGIAGLTSPTFRQWIGWAVGRLADLRAVERPALAWSAVAEPMTPVVMLGVLALAMIAVLAPVALYLARGDD